jgi:flagellar hook-associated protein 3 FlgL
MRVADSSIYEAATRHATRARASVVDAANKMSSGMRVTHPGDDATAATLALTHEAQRARLASLAEGVTDARGEIAIAEGALGGIVEILTKARELAVQLANDSYSASDRLSGTYEIDGQLANLTGHLNTQYGERYVFGGTLTSTPPFDVTGAYAGDAGVRSIEVAPGVVEAVNVRTDVAIQGASGGVDLYVVLNDLRAAFVANDANQIRAQLDALDAAITQVSTARTELGVTSNVFTSAAEVHALVADQERERTSALIEQDLISGPTSLAQAQSALEAVLAASAKTFDLSLLDRLK